MHFHSEKRDSVFQKNTVKQHLDRRWAAMTPPCVTPADLTDYLPTRQEVKVISEISLCGICMK